MKFIIERINVKVFLLSLAIGLLICYLTTPTPTVLFQHPTPENLDLVYKDKGKDQCYKYKSEEVLCSINSKETPDNKKTVDTVDTIGNPQQII